MIPETKPTKLVGNSLTFTCGGKEAPTFIVNGIDLAPMIRDDWKITNLGDGRVDLTVTFPIDVAN